jgi:hypothetical protein
MAKKELLQERSNPKKVRTVEGIGYWQEADQPCRSGMEQIKWTPETSQTQQCTENPDRMNIQVETLDRLGLQQWHKGSRPKTEATRQQVDKGPRRQTAAMSEKQEDIQLDLQEDHRQREDREVKSRILRHVAENQGMNLVEGSTPFKTGGGDCT